MRTIIFFTKHPSSYTGFLINKQMKYLSIFSGIGGFELGIQQAEFDLLGVVQSDCVGYSEIDKYAIQIYQKHFPKHKNYGDITTIDEKELPDFDLLCGGFPCQSFSIAGKRGGFDDTRGTLFFDIARIIKQKRPRLLLLENVKGLLSHDKGNTFTTIISTLDELGYDIQWQVLNSKNHGVPQNRERVFIIGHLRGTSRPQVFPFGEDDSRIDERKPSISGEIQTNPKDITGSTDTNSEILQDGEDRPLRIRRLTPLECERLQGFPDGWTEQGIGKIGDRTVIDHKYKEETVNDDGEKSIVKTPILGKSKDGQVVISDTQRYKCCGNAVTVNVIRDIMKKLL